MRCLLYIAYRMRNLVEPETLVERATQEYLRLSQWDAIPANGLLRELSQWYGILVPAGDAEWTFVHRTIHDFLAARYWVENGIFNPSDVRVWDSRAAYATCLRPNATEALSRALASSKDLFVLMECLNNNAAFEPKVVAHAVSNHFSRFPDTFMYTRDNEIIALQIAQDFFELAGDGFLKNLALIGGEGRGAGDDLMFAYSLAELRRRGAAFSPLVKQLMARRVEDGVSCFDIVRNGEHVRVVLGERD
jgi:hypothetical protein